MEIKDVVEKLIGNIYPIGETNADNKSFNNLETQIMLVDSLINEIHDVAKYNYRRNESSMNRSGTKAVRYLEELTLQLTEDYGEI